MNTSLTKAARVASSCQTPEQRFMAERYMQIAMQLCKRQGMSYAEARSAFYSANPNEYAISLFLTAGKVLQRRLGSVIHD